MSKEVETTEKTEKKQLSKPWLFPKGVSGNPNGRPKGSISPITRIKQMFEDDPTLFESFIREYMANPMNHKHIVEMIDGKPKGSETNVAVQINQNKIIFDDFSDETESE